VHKLISDIADSFADADALVTELGGTYAARLVALLSSPAERDADVWRAAEADPDTDVVALLATPVRRRDEEWMRAAGAAWAAAQAQAYAETVLPEVLRSASVSASITRQAARSTSRTELVVAATEGVPRAEWTLAAGRRVSGGTRI